MQQENKSKVVRINCEAANTLESIVSITGQSRGDVVYDALKIIQNELIKTDYNYSKIINKFRKG